MQQIDAIGEIGRAKHRQPGQNPRQINDICYRKFYQCYQNRITVAAWTWTERERDSLICRSACVCYAVQCMWLNFNNVFYIPIIISIEIVKFNTHTHKHSIIAKKHPTCISLFMNSSLLYLSFSSYTPYTNILRCPPSRALLASMSSVHITMPCAPEFDHRTKMRFSSEICE